MDLLALSTIHRLSGWFIAGLPLSLGNSPQYTNTALAPDAAYIIRADNGTPDTLVNVFNTKTGTKQYSISRSGSLSTTWYVFAEPEHIQVAGIAAGAFYRRVHFAPGNSLLMKPGQGALGKLHRHFHLEDGKVLSWNRRSKFLEALSSPDSGIAEHRTRVAGVNQLRANRFEWELLIDTSQIDVLKAITTAFVTMKTQWLLSDGPTIPGVRTPAAALVNEPCAGFMGNDPQKLQTYARLAPSENPRDFFNPPAHLEHKYRQY